MLISGVILMGYEAWYEPRKIRLKTSFIWPLIQIAVCGIFLSFVLEFWAMQYISSSKAALLYNLTPFVTALYAYWFFRERMTFKKSIGLIIGFVGFLPTVLWQESAEQVATHWSFLSMPELALFGSVLVYAYSWVVMKKFMLESHCSSVFINGITMLLGGVLSFVVTYVVGDLVSLPTAPLFWVELILIIILGNIIFYNLYGYLLKKYTVTFLAFSGFSIPFFTALYGYFLLNERIGWDFLLSSAIVFVGLYIFYQEELRQGYIQS